MSSEEADVSETKDVFAVPQDVMKAEEEKLKAKYKLAAGPMKGSAFLQKKLAKGQKYFDSGDYQMAKQSATSGVKVNKLFACAPSTGNTIPTPESVPARKTSIIQPKFSNAT